MTLTTDAIMQSALNSQKKMLAACLHCGGTEKEDLRFGPFHANYCGKHQDDKCRLCREFVQFQVKVDEAGFLLDQLLTQRSVLADNIRKQHETFVNRIPTETIQQILVNCLPPEPSAKGLCRDFFFDQDFDYKDGTKTLLAISQVCKLWREIALGTPELWNVLHLYMGWEKCWIGAPGNLQEWLTRSSSRPLFLRLMVSIDEVEGGRPSPQLETRIAPIFPHISRLRIVDLYAPPEIIPWFSSTTSFPLDLLSISKFPTSVMPNDNHSLNLETAPSHLRLHRLQEAIPTIRNWNSLTHLMISTTSSFPALQIFRHAPNIVECTLRILYLGESPVIPFLYPSLKKLVVSEVDRFWPQFSFPSLQDLAVEDGMDVEDLEYWLNLRDFLARSACPLKSFRLHQHRFEDPLASEQWLISVLEEIPSVQDLSIGAIALSDLFFQLATHTRPTDGMDATESAFLHSLHHLEYDFPEDRSFNWEGIVSFLTSRSSAESRKLRSLILRPHQDRNDSDAFEFTLDEPVLKSIVDAAQDIQVVIFDSNGEDLVKKARCGDGLLPKNSVDG